MTELRTELRTMLLNITNEHSNGMNSSNNMNSSNDTNDNDIDNNRNSDNTIDNKFHNYLLMLFTNGGNSVST